MAVLVRAGLVWSRIQIFWNFCMSIRDQGLGPAYAVSPGALVRGRMGSGASGFELAPVWGASASAGDFTHNTTMPTSEIVFFLSFIYFIWRTQTHTLYATERHKDSLCTRWLQTIISLLNPIPASIKSYLNYLSCFESQPQSDFSTDSVLFCFWKAKLQKERGRDRILPAPCSLHKTSALRAGLNHTETRNQELHLGLPCGCRDPKIGLISHDNLTHYATLLALHLHSFKKCTFGTSTVE